MKKTVGNLFFALSLLVVGMNVSSEAYTDKCRGCLADCFNPLLSGRNSPGGQLDCRHCDPFCSDYSFYCPGY